MSETLHVLGRIGTLVQDEINDADVMVEWREELIVLRISGIIHVSQGDALIAELLLVDVSPGCWPRQVLCRVSLLAQIDESFCFPLDQIVVHRPGNPGLYAQHVANGSYKPIVHLTQELFIRAKVEMLKCVPVGAKAFCLGVIVSHDSPVSAIPSRISDRNLADILQALPFDLYRYRQPR